ncbi:glutaredoxin domain-containing protein [Iamia majanohamensis]|uniref:Glutaredoxin domain-containing protein n=1 Tax=Iamia majanohamensis TaxID=467976 RepID=A0AAE9Y792_9ACTN|nr:glutaredoxin domain-containing protein [Iamia majanohamensis]WCO66946.1 glutaredoxin domain-containing protein [Iamia majanohamensis]
MDSPTDPTAPDPRPEPTTEAPPEVVVYWRPGCGFCAMLRRGLAKAGVPTREVDIWEDPDGAAVVRSAAGGNETVPTVAVGGQLLVNPRPAEVVALAEEAGVAVSPPEGGGLLDRLRGR